MRKFLFPHEFGFKRVEQRFQLVMSSCSKENMIGSVCSGSLSDRDRIRVDTLATAPAGDFELEHVAPSKAGVRCVVDLECSDRVTLAGWVRAGSAAPNDTHTGFGGEPSVFGLRQYFHHAAF